jgi:hypothetical protein
MNINIVRTSAEYFINSCVEMYMTTSTLLLIKVDLLKKLRTQSCMACMPSYPMVVGNVSLSW